MGRTQRRPKLLEQLRLVMKYETTYAQALSQLY